MHRRYLQCWWFHTFFLFLTSIVYVVSWMLDHMYHHVFFSLWTICLSSSHVHFMNGHEYLRRMTAQVFDEIPTAELGFGKYSCSSEMLFFFFHIHLFDNVRFPYSISSSIQILSWFRNSIPSVVYLFPLFITSMAYFFMPNSIPTSRLYIFIVVSQSLQFFFLFPK